MQTKTTVTRKLTVSAARAWQAVAGIGGLHVWFPNLASCSVEGSGVGAIRRIELVRGGKIVDHITGIQPDKMRLSYHRVESPFPVTSYFGTVEIFESFDGLGVVVWTIDFESAAEDSGPLNDLLAAGIATGIEGMRDALAAT